tara:strand:+ start:75 stop:476 length:402 start_codon:yes stop_codon:yes gene_type:complete
MKKSELKNIIKECVKEVIFEEGVLSGIITEVAQGLSTSTTVNPVLEHAHHKAPPQATKQMKDSKRRVLDAIGGSAYEDVKNKFSNPQLFEGTRPIPESGKGPLGSVAPGDSGVDISNLPGMSNWAAVAAKTRK